MSDEPVIDVEAINAAFREFVPHNGALGMVVEAASYVPAVAVFRLPWSEKLVGNPDSGVLHGGVITTLLDATAGACVFLKLRASIPIATLDLRIDHLKLATARRDIFARAECVRASRNVAFVRGVAYHDDERDPIATATATFMLGTKGKAVTDVAVAREGPR